MCKLFWWKSKNVGDNISPYLYRRTTDKDPKYINLRAGEEGQHVISTGSILEYANSESTVWGSGFISAKSKVPPDIRDVRAVRGPKTKAKLIEHGIACPSIYGDPGLLLSAVYDPKRVKKYQLGLIPHQVDQKNPVWRALSDSYTGSVIIDVNTFDVELFVDHLLECEYVVSSSLHGLILADSYGIPNVGLNLNEKVQGQGFKFYDYFASVGRSSDYLVSERIALPDRVSRLLHEYAIPTLDIASLARQCPWAQSIHSPLVVYE